MPTLKVLSGSTKRIYSLDPATGSILGSSAPIPGTYYPAGLSGDPADSSKVRILDTPWRVGSGAASKILTLDSSTLAVLDTENLPAGHWTDIKDDGTQLWLPNQTTGKFHTWSKAGAGELASYGPTYSGLRAVTRTDPTGTAIDGSDLYLFFAGLAEMWRVAVSAPTVVLQVISTAGTGMFGGEIDPETHDLFSVNDSTNETSRHALKAATDETVSICIIAGVGEVDPEPTVATGPLESSPGGYGIRGYDLPLGVIANAAQAAVTGKADLARRSHVRTVRDVGMIGNPALEAGMLISVVDAVTGTDELGIVDTYRTDMAVSGSGATYVATVAHIPWEDVPKG